MAEIIVSIENEIEWKRVLNLLHESSFPYRINKLTDSSFPSLNQAGSFDLIIAEKDYDDFLKLVGKVHPIQRITAEPVADKPKPGRFKAALVLYSLVMTVLFAKYYYIEQHNTTEKNFVYEWNLDNTKLTMSHKKTGDIYAVYYDNNFDFNYEKVVSYHKGIKSSMALDNDEDGQAEQEIVYEKTGKIIGNYIDIDKDGFFDEGMMVLESGDSLKFADQNKNGVFELLNRLPLH